MKNIVYRWLPLLLLSVLLAGCSSLSKYRHRSQGADLDEFGDAYTAGVGEQDEIKDRNQFQHATLEAPANQVYYFGFDQYDLKQDYLASVTAQARYLLSHPSAKIRLEGHTDERGSREYNIGLGWRRARAALAVFKANGVSQSQLEVVSYGKEKPTAFGHDESAHAFNRRVNIVYTVY